MLRRQLAEQREIDAIGALVGRGLAVDRDFRPRHRRRHRHGQIPDLVVPGIRSGVHRQHLAACRGVAADRPFDGARHVADVDQRPPRGAVGQDGNLAGRDGASREVVEDEVEPQAVAHAAGGGEPQTGDRHPPGIHPGEPALGRHFRARVGGQRIDLVAFAARPALGKAVNRARRGKDKGAHAGLAGEPGEAQTGLRIDLVGHLLEPAPHRVVRDSRQMDDRVDTGEQFPRQVAHIAVMLAGQPRFRQRLGIRQAMREEPGVVADNLGGRHDAAQVAHERRADIAGISGD